MSQRVKKFIRTNKQKYISVNFPKREEAEIFFLGGNKIFQNFKGGQPTRTLYRFKYNLNNFLLSLNFDIWLVVLIFTFL